MTSDEFAQRITEMTQLLYRVSYSQLQRACDREDAVQECLRKAWQHRGRLRDERYMQTWVIRILLNECRNIYKKNRREVPSEDVPPPAPKDSGDIALHDALLRLPDKLRIPLLLYYIEGFKVDEVADMLRLPTGTVKTRMTRGRKQLRELLREEVFEP
ncbi:sigma-70 family RNA polymerase sigma factor [Beduinella massiliensis]|uniref:sigma-70 family RNA polymerase sigma factor n=1 Tax=Beduinella massiliensis TaxID=1852363 RepID=UPI000C84110B